MPADVVHPDVRLAAAALAIRENTFPSLAVEPDNAAYGAALCEIRGLTVRFRVGKITPTKVGLFVTVWRRASDGSTQPFPADEDVDMLAVCARDGSRFGVFVFPKSALMEHGIVSVGAVGGKRGFRVYPPWSATRNSQAARSQEWQCRYFVEFGDEPGADVHRAEQLLNAH